MSIKRPRGWGKQPFVFLIGKGFTTQSKQHPSLEKKLPRLLDPSPVHDRSDSGTGIDWLIILAHLATLFAFENWSQRYCRSCQMRDESRTRPQDEETEAKACYSFFRWLHRLCCSLMWLTRRFFFSTAHLFVMAFKQNNNQQDREKQATN